MKDTTGQAFPSGATPGFCAQQGMTYKQWLVGQIVAGVAGTFDVSSTSGEDYCAKRAHATVKWARQLAEEVVKQDREA